MADSHFQEIQKAQFEYRKRLLAGWPIPAGARVLEVGCGQGDMTALLARAVGSEGRVIAVDIAGRDYGAPLTLGEATDLLKASSLGPQIDFYFNFDVLDPSVVFEVDYAVLAHSSWYFNDEEQLVATLKRIRQWARTLCFAEWDLEPHSLEQVAHLQAVLLQGQIEAFKSESQANVRTPLMKGRLKGLLERAGWSIMEERRVETRGLQDADWEINACRELLQEAEKLGLPLAPIASQLELLQTMALPRGNRPLDAYSLVAE